MRTISIPGGTAVLRDRPEELKERHHRLMDTAMVAALPAFEKIKDKEAWESDGVDVRSAKLTRQEAAALMERQDAQVVALLQSWSLDRSLPDLDTIQDLDRETYSALVEAARTVGNETDVFGRPDFSEKPGENPTVPSSDSEKSEREDAESDSTPTSSSDGTSTDTGSSSKSRTKSS